MAETVAIVDYGSGNLRSAAKALEHAARQAGLESRVVVTSDAGTVRAADRVVLPGVGAFPDCMTGLTAAPGLKDALVETVTRHGRPFLGICVGMQLMAEWGVEFGRHAGLGWIEGEIARLTPADPALKIPHMGWNTLKLATPHMVTADLADVHVYFVHSFALTGAAPAQVLASCDYGGAFAAVVGRARLPDQVPDMAAVSPFTLYPAIDLKDGQCVRLVRGEMASATVFNASPGAQAAAWQQAGFAWIHVVDLNGAFEGRPVNRQAVRDILGAVDVPVQLGGGIRDRRQIEAWLEAGISRVILGTIAARNPHLVKDMALAFPGRIAVGIDAKDFRVAVQGWAEDSELDAAELAARYQGAGVAALIFTDIGRDGTGQGLNVEQTLRVAKAAPGVPVIASGGLGSLDDIRACRATAGAIGGVICGRALYDGRVNPREALTLSRQGA